MVKKLIALLLFLGLAGGGWYWWKHSGTSADELAPVSETAKVSLADIVQKVECTGRVEAFLEVEIKSKASGEVVELPRDISDPVKKGDLLLRLDPVDEERNVSQGRVALTSAKASLLSAEVKLEELEARAKRTKELHAKGLASDEELQTAQSAARQAKASADMSTSQVERETLNLANVQRRLKETTILSPIDGVVTERKVQFGQIVTSGISSVSGGTVLMKISDVSRLFVRAAVNESDIGSVKVGQKVEITVDAFARQKFGGEVVRIAAKGETLNNVTVFDVMVEVTSENKTLLKPEMTTFVGIITKQSLQVVAMPLEAVFLTKEGATVRVGENDATAQTRKVKLGVDDSYLVEVTEGLKAGETILLERGSGGAEGKWKRDASGKAPANMRNLRNFIR